MEFLNYLPVYQQLPDAVMVAVPQPEWFDLDRAVALFEEARVAYRHKPTPDAACAVTTQYHHEVEKPEYRNSVTIRLMYGLAEKLDNLNHSERMNAPFDAVLVPGEYSRKLISRFTNAIIVGFPKYDAFFRGELNRAQLIAGFGLDPNKPTIAYLPTWDVHSSLDLYRESIRNLAQSNEFNFVLKPHTVTVRHERQRIDFFRPDIDSGKMLCIEEQIDPAKILTIADFALADGASGAVWDAAIVAKLPTLALNTYASDSSALERRISEVALVNNEPERLLEDFRRLTSQAHKFKRRQDTLAEELIAFRDGTAARHAADEIINFIERKRKAKTTKASQILTAPDSGKNRQDFKRKKRNIIWICIDGLRVDKLFCCGNRKRPKLFLDEVLSGGVLFTKVFSAAAGTHTAMHAVFTSMYPASNGVKGWTPEAMRRIDPHVLSLTDFLKRAGYETFRYCDLDGEQVVPKSGFDVWESSGYGVEHAIENTGPAMDCPKRDEFIHQYNQSKGPKFAYLHMELLHELNCRMKNFWPSEEYERNIVEAGYSFEQLLRKFDIKQDDLLIISTDHGSCLDSYWAQEERQLGPRHAEYSNLTFCSFITEDLAPCRIDKLVGAIDIAPTILDIVGAGPMGAQGRSLLALMLGGTYSPAMVFREKGAAYDIPASPDESNLWCVRTERWKYVTHKWRKGCEWLIDLENDPDYTNNLIGKGLEIENVLRDAVHKTLIDNPKKPLEIYAENNLDFSRRDIKPVISVIMPVENAASHLKDSVESLLAQTGPYFELIIVDGDETEDTGRKILGLYGDYPHVHYHRLKQRSLDELLNFAIQQAGGSYIALALPEIIYEENFLYELKKQLDSNADVGLAYSDYEVVDEAGNIVRYGIAGKFDSESLGVRNYVGPCVLFKSSLLEKSGFFTNEKYLCWDIWKRMAQLTDFGNVPRTLARCYELKERIAGPSTPVCPSRRVPKISVVLPTYNHLKFLPKAVESVLAQTYDDFELIIVNDGSADGTREYLDSLQDRRIRVIHQENKRLPEALNTGFRAARGELLTWVSSDNYCAPIFLEAFVAALDAYPDAGFAYSSHAWIDENDQITGICEDQDVSYHRLLASGVGVTSFMYRRLCQQRVGLYDPALEGAEDWDMWLRILEQFQPVYVPDILGYYRRHRDSMTEKVKERILRASRQTFQKAVKRRNNQFDMAELYPTIELCRDIEAAKFYAYFDFGTTLLQSQFTQVEPASQALEKALSMAPDSFQTAGNLAVAYGRLGWWEKVVPLLRQITQKTENPKALGICRSIVEAHKTNKPHLLGKISLFVPDKESIELFQLEKEHKFVFSFTDTGPRKNLYVEQRKTAAKKRPESGSARIELKKEVRENFKIGMAVLACNRPEYLEICLDTLFQTKLYNYDITFLLQDDGSTDPRVRDIIEKPRDPKYKIVRFHTPKGHNSWGAAFNKAMMKLLEIDDFDIIGSCDSDALFHPEWLDKTMKICLWAKKNHTDHILGPFSSFNSSDYKFHKILGTYQSPYGGYVVKERMGAVNYFYFKEDFIKLGFFEEHRDDETLMTEKFKALQIRNFSTETSYVEHIGQVSILNQWRPGFGAFGAHAMKMAKTGWPAVLGQVGTLGYFKYIHKNASLEPARCSNTKIDILIPVVEKDLDTLPLVIDGARENLRHPVEQIFVVAPQSHEIKSVCLAKGCEFVPEDSVLPVIKKNITHIVDGVDRSGWLFQQLIKWAGDSICMQEHYLALDADTVLVRPQVFEVNGKMVLLHSDKHHHPYFELYKRLFGVEAKTMFSFVSSYMLFNKSFIGELKRYIEKRSGVNWVESLFKNLDTAQASGMSACELYGQWMFANHADKIIREYWFNISLQRQMYTPERQTRLKRCCRSVTFERCDTEKKTGMSPTRSMPAAYLRKNARHSISVGRAAGNVPAVRRHSHFVIEVKYGGIGDHLLYSHLPYIAKQSGKYDKVYVSNHSVYRDDEYRRLVWELNPYVDGFCNEHGRYPLFESVESGMNLLDKIMLLQGLDDGERFHEPKLYVRCRYRNDLSDAVVYDPNYISNAGRICSADVKRYLQKNNIHVTHQMALRNNSHPIECDNVIHTPTLEEFFSVIVSCRQLICLTTGTATIAAALGKPATVLYGPGVKAFSHHSRLHNYVNCSAKTPLVGSRVSGIVRELSRGKPVRKMRL